MTDPYDRTLALGVDGVLGAFNRAELLTTADVRIAIRVAELVGERSESVRLAAALAVRAVRHGSTCFELGVLADEIGTDLDLPWPDPATWLDEVAASPLVDADVPVLRVESGLLYLDRYFELETDLCRDLVERGEHAPPVPDEQLLAADLARLFPGEGYAEQRDAADGSARRWTTVLTGGPGTGKTTALARLLVVLASQAEAAGRPPLRVALAAPTGKAAARMKEAVAAAAANPDVGFTPAERTWLAGLTASTMHRLLGYRPDNSTRFRHDRQHRLGHDVVVIDESSMVSLTLMARLVEAVRPDSRLILVGDPDQLASIEAGTVLRDLVTGWGSGPSSPVAHLAGGHRFGHAIGRLAAAVRDGDADAAIAAVEAGHPNVRLVPDDQLSTTLRELVLPDALTMAEAAAAGDVERALSLLGSHRLLCAHREGPHGAETWNQQVERWLDEETGYALNRPWYPGRPVLVTENDRGLRLYNGDTGVTVPHGEGVTVVIAEEERRRFAPSRLGTVQTAYAMTVHRSQGSQFDHVTVLLPDDDSRLLTRELLYTALTRAETSVTLVGSEDAVRAAIATRVLRASGLAERLTAVQP